MLTNKEKYDKLKKAEENLINLIVQFKSGQYVLLVEALDVVQEIKNEYSEDS